MEIITIQNNCTVPKYKQIVLSIEKSIENGILKKNDRLPSVNKITTQFKLSRVTVLLAYDNLKKRGLITAVFGKGYYVRSTEIKIKERVFLLFDEFNSFKEDLYLSFISHVGKDTQIDIYFHHFNSSVFEKQITENIGIYNKYIIMPTHLNDVASIISKLPENDVYIIDQTNESLKKYPAIYQNFKKDIYEGLLKGKAKLDKYDKLILIFPGFREPLGMKEGFLSFVKDFNFENEIITDFDNRKIQKGEVYIIPNDRDLVSVLEKAKKQKLTSGLDFGIISYNETPLKRIVGNGITTISTDFQAMGRILAQLSSDTKKQQIENRADLILRNSL
jgi:DNA-binding transcriptional regulator YhcF (GntR family)